MESRWETGEWTREVENERREKVGETVGYIYFSKNERRME